MSSPCATAALRFRRILLSMSWMFHLVVVFDGHRRCFLQRRRHHDTFDILCHYFNAGVFRPHKIGARVLLYVIGTQYYDEISFRVISNELDCLKAVHSSCAKLIAKNQDVYSVQSMQNLLISTVVELDTPAGIDRSKFGHHRAPVSLSAVNDAYVESRRQY